MDASSCFAIKAGLEGEGTSFTLNLGHAPPIVSAAVLKPSPQAPSSPRHETVPCICATRATHQDCPGSGLRVLLLDTQVMKMKATVAGASHSW